MSARGTFHQLLIGELRALIRSPEFAPGAKFLTEREIAERFETSRPTANKALSSLVSEGWLEVRRGAGTFIRETVLDYDLERLVSFTDKARAAGMRAQTEVVAFRRTTAGEVRPEVRSVLRADTAAALFYMERVRLADRRPVIFERRHVLASLCPNMSRKDAKGSLYHYWTEVCAIEITGADEIIHAVNATKEQAARLQITPRAACFAIVATGFTSDHRPLWHEETVYRADVYEFRNRIGGLAGSRAAMGRLIGQPPLHSRNDP